MAVYVAGSSGRGRLQTWSYTYRAPTQRVYTIGMVVDTNVARTLTPQLVAPTRLVKPVVVSTDLHTALYRQRAHPKNDYLYQFPIEVSAGQSVVLGQAVETDVSRPLAKTKSKTFLLATETDVARALLKTKSKAVSRVTETDTASLLTPRFPGAIARVTETDVSQTLLKAKSKSFAQVVETDVSRTLGKSKSLTFLRATETDLARALSSVKRRTILVSLETDIALTFLRRKSKSIGQTTEGDTARSLTVRTVLGRAVENDLAGALSPSGGEPPTPDVIVTAPEVIVVRWPATVIVVSTTPPVVIGHA
jgi:hypothetical protein